jgi:hypothetical protein
MSLHEALGRADGVRRTYEALEARLGEIGGVPGQRSQAFLLEPSGPKEQRVGDA